jgi:molecular chaperone DnaJ
VASQDWLDKDFYAVLGVSPDVDEASLKRAYRKLAREWHPDSKPGDATAEQRFKEIGEAYAVLSDPEQRREYDAIRQMASGGARFTAGSGAGAAGAGAGFVDLFGGLFGSGGGTRVRFATGGDGRGTQPDLEDLLGGLFGGDASADTGHGRAGGFDGFGTPGRSRRGRDVTARVSLSFRQAVTGDTVTLQGADGQQTTVRIPAGVRDGQKIRLRGKGGAGGPGAPNGDLILTVQVEPHPVFGREGNDLIVQVPVTFAEAALGATVSVPTLTGAPVKVKVPAGTPDGRVLRVKGRGVHTKKGTGDLLARIKVVVPRRLSSKAREAVQVLRAEQGGADPRAELFAQARR